MQKFLPDLVFIRTSRLPILCACRFIVSKLARDSGRCLLQVGEGADEIFSGYETTCGICGIYEKFATGANASPLLRRAASAVTSPALEATGKKARGGLN